MKVMDLHLHTKASDGHFSPTAIVRAAREANLSAISITDHDTMDGVDEALEAGKEFGIEVIRGVEFSCDVDDDEIHILGYFFKRPGEELFSVLEMLKKKRYNRAERIVKKLNSLNIELNMEDVLKFVGNPMFIGRPHIALAMVERKIVRNPSEAFDEYLCIGKLAYEPRDNGLEPKKVIDLIKRNKGLVSLAHPGYIMDDNVTLGLIEYGIHALEVFHVSHDEEMIQKYMRMVHENGLFITGGSDYHGHNDDRPVLGKMSIPYEYLRVIKEEF